MLRHVYLSRLISLACGALALLAAVSMTNTSATAADSGKWGDLTGQFIYGGKVPEAPKLNITKDQEVCGKHDLRDESLVVGNGGELANVVVYVRTKKVAVHPSYAANAKAKVKFDNEHCRFEPHILPMVITQTLVLHNSDPISHNSNMTPLGDQALNPLLNPMGATDYNFHKAQIIPVPVVCNIHPWMKGYVVPRDNPYVTISDKDGKFTLKNLPAGEELEFQVWHEKAGYLAAKPQWKLGRFKMTIKPGANDLGTMKVSPDLLNK